MWQPKPNKTTKRIIKDITIQAPLTALLLPNTADSVVLTVYYQILHYVQKNNSIENIEMYAKTKMGRQN